MAVIAVLVAVAIPTFGSQLEKARQATDMSNLRGAYAASKLAILNQTDKQNNPLKTAALTTAIESQTDDTALYYFWYDVDSGTLSYAVKDDAVPAGNNYKVGKATTASIVVDQALPEVISYASALADSTDKGAVDKGVLIVVQYTKSTNVFELSGITFAKKAALVDATLSFKSNDAAFTSLDVENWSDTADAEKKNKTLEAAIDLSKPDGTNALAFVDADGNTVKGQATYALKTASTGLTLSGSSLSGSFSSAVTTEADQEVEVTVTIVSGATKYSGDYKLVFKASK